MYCVQALWTAAHLALPITYVIVNNGGYRIIKERLVSMRKSERFVGMDITEPRADFVAIARGFGMDALRVTDPGDVVPAVRRAIDSGAPNLIEVVVASGFG
jgi:benzoylformate decarboxylase